MPNGIFFCQAARAGEHGRGFAIVAEFIGKLAAESASATENIERIIEELYSNIGDTVSNIEEVKKTMSAQIQVSRSCCFNACIVHLFLYKFRYSL